MCEDAQGWKKIQSLIFVLWHCAALRTGIILQIWISNIWVGTSRFQLLWVKRPCSVPPILLISFFPNKGIGILSFSPLCICTSVGLQSSTGLHKFYMHDLKSNAFISPHLRGTEHFDQPQPISQSENPLIRKYVHLTTKFMAFWE